mgnify:CR=1 FL=1
MTLNGYFDKIYCINLARRPEKWEDCIKEFKKHNLNVEKFIAIDGATINGNGRISGAEIGCLQSHQTILQKIVSEKLKRALILEDDVEFISNLQDEFSKRIKEVPEWQMLYLGGNHVTPTTKINQWFSKLNRSYTTSHYAVTLERAEYLLNLLKRSDSQIDVIYSREHENGLCYTFQPSIAWQRPGYSDIQKGFRNYTGFMKEK